MGRNRQPRMNGGSEVGSADHDGDNGGNGIGSDVGSGGGGVESTQLKLALMTMIEIWGRMLRW